MISLLILLVVLVVCLCVYGFIVYRRDSEQRARDRRRKQFHDRV